jgi:hypothetical protein
MSYYGKTESKRRSKFLRTENNDNNSEKPKLMQSKTFQGEGFFFIKKKNVNNAEQRRLKRLEKSKEIINNISKRLLKQDSLFITGFNGEVRTPFKKDNFNFHVPRIKLKSDVNILKNYNVFETEDEYIRKIMYKLYIHENIKKKNEKDKKRMILDKIYGFSPNHKQSMKKAKRKKFLPLKEYQDNILITFANNYSNIDNGKFLDLIQNFKDIRAETESITPLPKINIDVIKEHIFNKGVKNYKKMTLKEYFLKDNSPLDEFEKENIIINKLKTQRYTSHPLRNKRNKNFDILPQYLKDKFNNQIKYHG